MEFTVRAYFHKYQQKQEKSFDSQLLSSVIIILLQGNLLSFLALRKISEKLERIFVFMIFLFAEILKCHHCIPDISVPSLVPLKEES